MAPLKFYYDLASQPVRSVWMLLKANNIPFEPVSTSLFKGEHKADAYVAKVPAAMVPAIEDGDFVLTECVAILLYISRKYSDKVAPNWYPADVEKRARVDEYMSWQHTGIRKHGSTFFIAKVIKPNFLKQEPDKEKIQEAISNLANNLDFIEKNLLGNSDYIAGDDITLADLMAITEIMQPVAGGFGVEEGRPKIAAWMKRVKERLGDVFTEAHKPLLELCGQSK